MTSKRPFAYYDDGDNSIAKRQHLELFPNSTNSILDGSTTVGTVHYEHAHDHMDTASPRLELSTHQSICFGTVCPISLISEK
jgi:hypothetical protein